MDVYVDNTTKMHEYINTLQPHTKHASHPAVLKYIAYDID